MDNVKLNTYTAYFTSADKTSAGAAKNVEASNNSTESSAAQSDVISDEYHASRNNTKAKVNDFLSVQEESTKIDLTNQSLKKITDLVEDVKSTVLSEDASQEAVKEVADNTYKKIQDTADKTSFNDEKLIDSSTIEELEIPEVKNISSVTREEKNKSVEKLDKIIQNLNEKSQVLEENKTKLVKKVNSYVEIKISPEKKENKPIEPAQKQSDLGTDLKNAAVASISENSTKNKEFHISHIDGNLLLAMLSLRS